LQAQHQALVAEQDERLRQRTAELEAIVRMQVLLLEQQRADRTVQGAEESSSPA
jgi:hypothetical protein